jgi:hypothetical protein
MTRHRLRPLLIAGAVLATVAAVFSLPPIPQDPGYHRMADTRVVLGVPNGLNVLSNAGFALVGAWGLAVVLRGAVPRLRDPWERRPYAVLFAGTLLTAAGSAYYHLAPTDARLVWDRLPMTVAFMGLVAAVVAERVNVRASRALLAPLVLAGASSVGYWYLGELRGSGDLRPYVLVQFGSLAVVAAIAAAYPGRPSGRYLVAGLAAYLVAKGFESADRAVLEATGIVSGHTLKHVAAAMAPACLALMLSSPPAEPQPHP